MATISSICRDNNDSRSTVSATAPQLKKGPSGNCHLSSRKQAPCPNRLVSDLAEDSGNAKPIASAISAGCGSMASVPTSAQKSAPFLASIVHNGPTFASSSASWSTTVHSPALPLAGPQEPGPVPNSARTTPSVSIVKGTNSAENPSQRKREPGLKGKRPAERCALECTSSNQYSSASSSPSLGWLLPDAPMATSRCCPRAAKATERPGVEITPMGKPLSPYTRSNRREVNAAAKVSPQATASTASPALPSEAWKTAFSHRSAGRIVSWEPPSAPSPAARQQAPPEIAAMLNPMLSLICSCLPS
mmetsp:Transcript_118837/g.296351  ORF Transcript_118837/g.296351 Transcript_118837/m.296351 type:complete len:304 (-) Transcript_118837:418-1329(-)